ncbi:MAG: caspase family protein, partial [Planctomycetaceae bacterium]|nr:caspase family protein [Planctomycetaceae bacterium]
MANTNWLWFYQQQARLALLVTSSLMSVFLLSNSTVCAEEKKENHNRYALLVGCTAYPKLEKKYSLKGSSNDVQLTVETLKDPRFGYTDKNIITLIHENSPE